VTQNLKEKGTQERNRLQDEHEKHQRVQENIQRMRRENEDMNRRQFNELKAITKTSIDSDRRARSAMNMSQTRTTERRFDSTLRTSRLRTEGSQEDEEEVRYRLQKYADKIARGESRAESYLDQRRQFAVTHTLIRKRLVESWRN